MGLIRLKSRYRQAPFLLEAHFLAFSSFQNLLAFLGSFPSSSTPAVQRLQISLLCVLCFRHVSFSLSLLPHCFACKDPLLLHWPHTDNPGEYLKIFSLITPAKSLVLWTVRNSQVLGNRIGTSFSGHCSTTISKLIQSFNTAQLFFNLTV